jgi:hypothetical protein
MADDKLFPYQARVPVTADGALPSVDLIQFLNKLFRRVGEYTALTNVQLEALNSQAVAGEMIFQPMSYGASVELLMQAPAQSNSFNDLMQPIACDQLTETTFQG